MRIPVPLQAVLLSLFIAVSLLIINWHFIIGWILVTQQTLHELLRTHVAAVGQDPFGHGLLLVLIAFGYGVFHAIGPGHGKALVASYLGSQTNEGFRQGVLLSFMGSLFQSVVAIVLVSVFALILSVSVSKITQQDWVLEAVSFTLVAMLGAVMLVRALWNKHLAARLVTADFSQLHFRPEGGKKGFSLTVSDVPLHQHGTNCGCQHHIAIEQTASWKEKLLLISAMGMRPCSGALIVLVYSHLVGVYAFGVLAVIGMGLGTGMAVAVIAVVVVSCRQWFQRRLGAVSSAMPIDVSFWLKLFGGALLLFLGISLLMALNFSPPTRPIL